MGLSNKRLFITGGTGFIGSSIAERFIENNHIMVYDNFNKNLIENTPLYNHPNLTVINGDVLDYDKMSDAFAGHDADIIIHLAAILGVETVISDPVRTMETNLMGAMNILNIAKSAGTIEHFINFSTSEVYGAYSYKLSEGDSTSVGGAGEARWLYALSKLATDHLALSYYKKYSFPVTSVRPFNIYGPRRGEAALYQFVSRALENEDLLVHGDGDQIRSWCYIDDFVDAIELCLLNDQSKGQIFNIGNPRATVTILSLAELVIRLTESRSRIRFIEKDYSDIELRIPTIDKAKELLGYSPKVDLTQGILETVSWYKTRGESVSIDKSRDIDAGEKY